GHRRARLLFVAATVGSTSMLLMPLFEPAALPADAMVPLFMAMAATCYLAPALVWARSWRLLRLRPQLAIVAAHVGMATGCIAAGGVWPEPLPLAAEMVIPASVALFAFGNVSEARVRPGLRTLVLGLLLPRATDELA